MAYRISTGSGPRRLISIALVIVLQLFFIWGLQSGLSGKIGEVFHEVEAKVIKEAPPKPKEEPPPPPPEMEQPPPFVPPPEIDVAIPTTQSQTAITQTTQQAEPDTEAVGTRITKPRYPSSSIQNCEQGAVTLSLSIDEHGKVTDVKLDESSGYPALDAAAAREAHKWRFRPARLGGQSVASIKKLKVIFNLKDELGRRQIEECERRR